MGSNINIYDKGFIYFSLGLDFEKKRARRIDNLFSGSYIGGFIYFFLRFIHSLIFYNLSFPKRPARYNGCVLYGMSQNNINSLLPIQYNLGEEVVVSNLGPKTMPLWKTYWYAIPHLGELIAEIRRATPENKAIIKNKFAIFWRLYGCPHMIEQYLDYYQPKVIVVANDHITINRCLIDAANKRGLKTIYVQHAAVTTKFPPLDFTYAFLDGIDSYEKYAQTGKNNCTVYLSGGVRFDAISVSKKKSSQKFVIGIALNMLDDRHKIEELCLKLNEQRIGKQETLVVLRPHPSIIMKPWQKWCSNNGIEFSLPSKESSFDFLNRIDFMISNQSSIHLDSILCHTPSVIYNMAINKPEDGYGFIKRGLVPEAANYDELISLIMNHERYTFNYDAARYYNGSYGSRNEGHVGEIISDMIETLCNDKFVEDKFNKKYDFYNLIAEKNFRVFGVK